MNEKPELLYEDLQLGREFEPFEMKVDTDVVEGYLAAIERKDSPLYHGNSADKALGFDRVPAPHGLAAIYARLSYLKNYIMPGGGILARQEFQFLRPIFLEDRLICNAKVVDRYRKKERNYVVFEINTYNQNKESVSIVRIVAIWPK